MYLDPSFKNKAQAKLAIKIGRRITVFQPNAVVNVTIPTNGVVSVEGPNYQAHTWYGRATIVNGVVTKLS